jgi:hypothetical protein
MKKLLIFSILGLLVGGMAGGGAGLFLAPENEADLEAADSVMPTENVEDVEHPDEIETTFVEFSDQFLIPIVGDNDVEAMVVLNISIEVDEPASDTVHNMEPKLRAAFLQSLFNHANHGGFDANFTAFSTMDSLRRELWQVARNTAGPSVRDVLILDIIRQ